MLDVHPPHHATHTWRDFFIHIATIVVGLLIAVGLEQTVEAIHHQHVRHLLEDELRLESKLLQRNAGIDVDQYDAQLKFLLAERKDAGIMIASNGKAVLPVRVYIAPPQGQGRGLISLLNPSWESARADGRVALLPESLKRAYGVVSNRKGIWDVDTARLAEANGKINAYVYQFSDIRTPRTPALSRMSQAQLIEYRALLTDAFEKLRSLRQATVAMCGDLNLVLMEQLPDQESLAPADGKFITEAQAAHPEQYSRLADEIDAEDATRDKSSAKTPK